MDHFETVVAEEAHRRGADGVIAGHIHKAQVRDIKGITYMNDGDWVESCTALVEDEAGKFEILHWTELRAVDMVSGEIGDLPGDRVAVA